MKKTAYCILASLLLFTLPGPVSGQEKVTLEYHYKQGVTYLYQNNTSYDMIQEMNGQEMKTSGSSQGTERMVIDSVAQSGDFYAIISYDAMKTIVKNSMMDTVIDQKELIGKRGRVGYNKLGKELSKKVIDTIHTSGMMSASRKVLSIGLIRFPGNKVTVGDKWSSDHIDSVNIGDGMSVTKAHTDFAYMGIEDRGGRTCHKFSFVSKSETTGKFKQMGMEFFLEGGGDTVGHAWVDVKDGVLVSKESVSTQDMTYAMNGQMEMAIPSSQTIRTNYNLLP